MVCCWRYRISCPLADGSFGIKRIPWRTPLRILIASYWFSFGVGVVQWLSIHLRIKTLTDYFAHLMYRQYINESSVWGGGRPQFLFAEPSYIGMHLFGVLLPLMWLMRGRDRIYAKRLRNLIVVYAIGAVLMQAGTRIVLDSVVALLVAIIVHNSWCDKKQRVRGIAQLLGAVKLGLLGVLADSRLSSIAENGAEEDGSFFARIYQSLDPICGLLAHPWTVLTGYGAGNIINAVWAGAKHAGRLLNGLGMNGSAAVGFAAGISNHSGRQCSTVQVFEPCRSGAAISEMRRVSLLRVQWSRPVRTAAPRYLYARRQSMAVYAG